MSIRHTAAIRMWEDCVVVQPLQPVWSEYVRHAEQWDRLSIFIISTSIMLFTLSYHVMKWTEKKYLAEPWAIFRMNHESTTRAVVYFFRKLETEVLVMKFLPNNSIIDKPHQSLRRRFPLDLCFFIKSIARKVSWKNNRNVRYYK